MNQPTFRELPDDVRIVTLTLRDLRDAARLLSRIAAAEAIAQPARPDANFPPAPADEPSTDVPSEILIERARSAFSERRRRIGTFGGDMFAETAWDILLLLYIEQNGQRLTVGRVTDRVGAALTTVLRWLQFLETRGFIRREPHPNDARAVFVELTKKAIQNLDFYFSDTLTSEK